MSPLRNKINISQGFSIFKQKISNYISKNLHIAKNLIFWSFNPTQTGGALRPTVLNFLMPLKNHIQWGIIPPWLFLKFIWENFGRKKIPPILITWPITTSSVTWPTFRKFEKPYLGESMIYHWKEELISFSTSPTPPSHLNPFTS